MAYTYTDAGDLLTLTDDFASTGNDVTFTDTYTNAHQLASEATSNSAYVYSGPATTTKSYTANTLNQYSAWDGTALAYDPKGNYLGTAAFPVFTYDAENRLLRAIAPSATDNVYTYDPHGRRTAKAVTTVSAPVWGTPNWNTFTWTAASAVRTSFLHDGDNEIAEYDNAGSLVRRFVPGPAIDEYAAMVTSGGTKTFPLLNRQGSLIATTDTSGARVEGPFTYDAYGACFTGASSCYNTLAATTFPFKFVGMRLDAESNTYYVRARNYTATLGRFLQTDPVGYKDDYNLYTYVGNDPADKTDPTGLVMIVFDPKDRKPIQNFINARARGAYRVNPKTGVVTRVAGKMRMGRRTTQPS